MGSPKKNHRSCDKQCCVVPRYYNRLCHHEQDFPWYDVCYFCAQLVHLKDLNSFLTQDREKTHQVERHLSYVADCSLTVMLNLAWKPSSVDREGLILMMSFHPLDTAVGVCIGSTFVTPPQFDLALVADFDEFVIGSIY